jgi:hypothetical protein
VSTQRHTSRSHTTVVLAAITGVVLCIGLVLNLLSLFLGDDFISEPTGDQAIDILFAILGMVAAVSCIWFWLLMFADYFKNRPPKSSTAWGWALVFLNVGAALAYFWLIWRPRYAETLPENA